MNRRSNLTDDKRSKVLNLYIKAENEIYYKKINIILQREGRSLSDLIWDHIKHYVSVHCEGNPQLLLDYVDQPKMLPKWRTCQHSKKELHDGEFYCNQTHFYNIPLACDRCSHYE